MSEEKYAPSRTSEPPVQDWPTILEQNRAHRTRVRALGETFDVDEIRQRLVLRSLDTLGRRADLASELGRPLAASPLDAEYYRARFEQVGIVATGHQCNVFHPGIDAKYDLTNSLARSTGAVGLAFELDTDVGSGGAFESPLVSQQAANPWPAVIGIEKLSLTDETAGDIYAKQRLGDGEQIAAVRRDIRARLEFAGKPEASKLANEVLGAYQNLAEQTVADAHWIVRRWYGRDRQLLPLSLSQVCRDVDVERFLVRIAANASNVLQSYNASLQSWREDRGIRNVANPFPDLQVVDQRIELPLWFVDLERGSRHRMWRDFERPDTARIWKDDEVLGELPHAATQWSDLGTVQSVRLQDTSSNSVIVPRGAFVSIVFRVLLSDLFVHGLGGNRYDQFTDSWLPSWVDGRPPQFVAASETRLLFPQSRDRLAQLDQIAAKQRQLAHHPDQAIGDGVFDSDTEQKLQSLLSQKQLLVESLRGKKESGESAAEEGKQLQELQRRAKVLVAEGLEKPLADLAAITPEAREAITCRTYPWFYFA